MARGGYRPGAGRKPGTKGVKEPKPRKSRAAAPGPATVPADIKQAARLAQMTPKDYMLQVMNDPEAAVERRDRMAIAAAPFCHARAEAEGGGKKEQRAQRAKEVGIGRFATPAAPKLVVDNG